MGKNGSAKMKFEVVFIIVVLAFVLTYAFCGGTGIHFHKRPKDGEIRIACVGDSITNGALIPGCWFRSYPTVLSRSLGDKYHVENFGLNSRTLHSNGNKPYIAEKEYSRSIEFKPDIVIFLLGANDTKEINWRSEDEFADEYVKFIQTYQEKNPGVKIIICNSTWCLNAENKLQGFTNDTNADLFSTLADAAKKVGEKLNLPIIDIYSKFLNRRDLLSYDNIHPNSKGAKVIAEEVRKGLEKYGMLV